jgi:hypothetical protein
VHKNIEKDGVVPEDISFIVMDLMEGKIDRATDKMLQLAKSERGVYESVNRIITAECQSVSKKASILRMCSVYTPKFRNIEK